MYAIIKKIVGDVLGTDAAHGKYIRTEEGFVMASNNIPGVML